MINTETLPCVGATPDTVYYRAAAKIHDLAFRIMDDAEEYDDDFLDCVCKTLIALEREMVSTLLRDRGVRDGFPWVSAGGKP